MNEDDKLRLQRNHELIVENVRLCDVVDKLVSDFVLDDDLVEKIELNTTSRERIQILLRILPTRGQYAYNSFRAALLCNECHRYIVTALDGTDLVKARKLFRAAVSKSSGPSTSGADVTNMAAILGPSTSSVDSYETTDSGMVSSYQTTQEAKKSKAATVPADPVKNMSTRDVIPARGTTHESHIQKVMTGYLESTLSFLQARYQSCYEDDHSVGVASAAATVPETRCPHVNYKDKGDIITIIPTRGATGDCGSSHPNGAAYCFRTNTILVADYGTSRIMRFDMDGSNGRHFVRPGDTRCGGYMPYDVAISLSGRVFVTDTENQRVMVFTRDGDYVKSIGSHGAGAFQFTDVRGITCHNGCVLVCDESKHHVAMASEDGVYMRHIVAGLSNPLFVAVGHDDSIYVTNYDVINGRHHGHVRKYRWDGSPVRQFGDREGAHIEPGGVTVDHHGYVCVAWSHRHRVDVYNPQGELYTTFGREGPGKLRYPFGLELLPDGRIVVCDYLNNRLVLF